MPPRKRTTSKKSTSKRRATSDRKRPDTKKRKTSSQKSIFPVHSIHQLMERKLPGGVVKPEAALFLTAVMEYLAAEILEQSMNAARTRTNNADLVNVRLTSNDVETALQNDPELKELMEKVRGRSDQSDNK